MAKLENITNPKIIKNINSIFANCESAKQLVVAEIAKIDAKYKALAEKEKAALLQTVKDLDKILAMNSITQASAAEDMEIEGQNEEQTASEDTDTRESTDVEIFDYPEEKNVEDEEDVVVDEEANDDETEDSEEQNEDDEWDEEETEDKTGESSDENEWGDMPEEFR